MKQPEAMPGLCRGCRVTGDMMLCAAIRYSDALRFLATSSFVCRASLLCLLFLFLLLFAVCFEYPFSSLCPFALLLVLHSVVLYRLVP